MEEPRSIMERVGSAMGSGNLAYHKDEGIGDVEVLAALGMAGAKFHPIASALSHYIVAQDVNATNEVREAVRALVSRHSVARDWNLNPETTRIVVGEVMIYLRSRVCPTCQGRKFKRAAETPMLTTVRCSACGGGGERVFPGRIREACVATINSVELLLDDLRRGVRYRLYGPNHTN